MPNFVRNAPRPARPVARGVRTIRRGIGFLQVGDFEAALYEFRRVAASKNPNTSRLVKSVASFYAYRTEVYRKEHKKAVLGNARLINLRVPGNARQAWSDVDIAAVLVAPNNRFTNRFLAGFLGRSYEAVRFQRRYVFKPPLKSWVAEPETYTRYTQAWKVAEKLGLV